jgi:hypothetical protein
MSRVSCDVVVVGSELAGLATAALIAQGTGGKRVIVVDDNDPCLALPLGDRFAPTAPSIVRLGATTGTDRTSLLPTTTPTVQSPVATLLDSLGMKQDLRRVLGETGGLGIIDDPDIRMVVPVDGDARVRELSRVFGAEEGALTAVKLGELSADARHGLYAEATLLHEDGFFDRLFGRGAKKRIAELGAAGSLDDDDPLALQLASLSLGVAAAQLVPFVQGLPSASAKGFAGLLASLQLQSGVHGAPRGGLGARAALAELLADIVRRHRGEVLRAKVEGVEADGKNITVVKASGANDYVARVVVDATSRRDFSARLPEGRRKEKLLESEKRVQLAGDAAVVRWLVPSSSLPRGLPPMSLVLRPPEGVPSVGGAVLIGVYGGAPLKEGHKAAGVDEGLVAIVAATTCPLDTSEAAAASVEGVLDHLLPFAKEQLKARDVVTGVPARAALPQWVVVDSEHPLRGRRPMTPFSNLLRAGRDLVPGLGVEGELLAARSVASVVEELLGANKAQVA